VAELYDRARPTYPMDVFAELAELAGLPPRARIVEIGCGTGQATRSLAQRGYTITCLELGEQLAELARRNLAEFPNVEVVTGDFETWQPDHADHDAVVAFGSFHWISPEHRYRRAAELVGASGKLAVVSTVHVLPDDGDPFFLDVVDDYAAVLGEDAREMVTIGRPPHPEAIADLSDRVIGEEVETSGVFRLTAARRYFWHIVYTADEYAELLMTVSSYRTLEPAVRERLFARIRRRIATRPGQRVRLTFMALLYVLSRAEDGAGRSSDPTSYRRDSQPRHEW
jgi:SAM-dependent methyltransferase